MDREGKFWVVSPNVSNKENRMNYWRKEILKTECAFMGWGDDLKIGQKFANEIQMGDIILIARRHHKTPEVIGFGVVTDHFEWFREGAKTEFPYGSMRELNPFRPLSRSPREIQLMDVLGHTMALAKLHPSWIKHRAVCAWMERELLAESKRLLKPRNDDQIDIRLAELQHQDESEFEMRSQQDIKTATREESILLNDYIKWLKRQGRKLHIAKYGLLRCDAFEEERNNLIEAKRGNKREHIRMAAGQLLDYAFQGRNQFGTPNLAILLPQRPQEIELEFGWLKENGIHLIWKDEDVFLDDCDGQFI
jgi:hypothetical protein